MNGRGSVSRSKRNTNRKPLTNSEGLLENRHSKQGMSYFGSEPETHHIKPLEYDEKFEKQYIKNRKKELTLLKIQYNAIK